MYQQSTSQLLKFKKGLDMDFYKVVKYVLMAVFAAIIVVGLLLAQDSSTNVQQNVPQTGSKFNF